MELLSTDADFASCAGYLPPAPLPAAARAQLVAAHTGQFASNLGGCAAQELGDAIARGYVTVDVVNNCTGRVPGDPGYFVAGGSGDASDANLLWGDYFYVDPAGNSAKGDPLVRIQAFPGMFGAGDATFYGSRIGFSAADDREPLARSWATRFLQRGGFDGGTDLIAWSDPGEPGEVFPCGGAPSWYPLTSDVWVFDEEEEVEISEPCPILCPPSQIPIPFPGVAGKAAVAEAPLIASTWGGPAQPTSFDFGWIYFGFRDATASKRSQAWLGEVMTATDRFAVGFTATPLESTCATPGVFP